MTRTDMNSSGDGDETNLLEKYKSKIKSIFMEEHELLLRYITRDYKEVIYEFKYNEDKKRKEEIAAKQKEADDAGKFFDERSVENRTEISCTIPDYNKITTEIIETYLTTHSKQENMMLNDTITSAPPSQKVTIESDCKHEMANV